MKTIIISAKKTLEEGNLVIFPTETVYGLGGNATNVGAIKKIYSGKQYIDDELQKRMLYKKSTDDDSQLSDLSTREFQIFCLLAEGLNTAEISKKLSISYKTAANYGTQIKNKLNVTTVADIARIAIRHNIIEA